MNLPLCSAMATSTPDIGFAPTTGALMRVAVERFGANDLVITPHARWTYAQIEAASRLLAKRMLASGIGKGTRVAAQLPFGGAWLITWLAVTRIGGLFLPLSTAYKPAELKKVLRIGDVHLLISLAHMLGIDRHDYLERAIPGLQGAQPELLLPELPFLRHIWIMGASSTSWGRSVPMDGLDLSPSLVSDALLHEAEKEVKPSDLMVVIFTSGTTSDPKAVVHTHGAMVRHSVSNGMLYALTEADRLYCGMPLFWVGGLAHTLLPALHVGAALLGQESFDVAQALDMMERYQATIIIGWEGVTKQVLAHPSYEARNIPAKDHPIYAPGRPGRIGGLGMTETCGPHSGTLPEERMRHLERPLNCVGRVRPGMERRIVDPQTGAEMPDGQRGAILVRGIGLMDGMLKRERMDVFERDGWYNTGDEGYLQDGLLYFCGRLGDTIKTSGSNVSPSEVESVLRRCAGVHEAYVAGLPDEQRGEIVAAALVPVAGQDIDLPTVVQTLRDEISNYKAPRRYLILQPDEVPWLATGKIDRMALKARLRDDGFSPPPLPAGSAV